MCGSWGSAMNQLQKRLILITHAATITLLMVSLPSFSMRWKDSDGATGLQQASEALSGTFQVSCLDHLWQPLMASLSQYRFPRL